MSVETAHRARTRLATRAADQGGGDGGSRLEHLPVTAFAVVMGLAGTAVAWQRAARSLAVPVAVGDVLAWSAAVVFVVVAVAHGVKAARHLPAVRAEWNRPPALAFVPTAYLRIVLVALSRSWPRSSRSSSSGTPSRCPPRTSRPRSVSPGPPDDPGAAADRSHRRRVDHRTASAPPAGRVAVLPRQRTAPRLAGALSWRAIPVFRPPLGAGSRVVSRAAPQVRCASVDDRMVAIDHPVPAHRHHGAAELRRLLAGVNTGDILEGVDQFLRALDGAARSEARSWFEKSRPWFREQRELPWSEGRERSLARLAEAEGLCAVALLAPAAAVRRVPRMRWYSGWSTGRPGEPSLVHWLRDADRSYVAAFVDAAARLNGRVSAVLRDAVRHHGLPCPTGATFLKEWLAGLPVRPEDAGLAPAAAVASALRRDPLMPDVLLHYLGSGHGGDSPYLPELLRLLVADGRVDRDAVLAVVLGQLTTQQRASAQRVLAGVLRELDLTAPEVPGGLAYLLGVLATSDGSVGRVLLPLALDLVVDAGGLADLVHVVAPRREPGLKEMLLRGLGRDQLRERAGDDAVRDALRTLAGDDDAAFAGNVRRALTVLGGGVAPEGPAATGLWDLPPQPIDVPPRPAYLHETATEVLSRTLTGDVPPSGVEADAWAHAELAAMVGDGRLDPRDVGRLLLDLLASGKLRVTRAARLLEDLFLSGCLRLMWPIAVDVADAAAALPRRPGRLEVLLRMLGGHAGEVPGHELPPHLIALAARDGSAKVVQEARRLGAVLAGEDVAAYTARIRAATSTSTPTPARPGLWTPPAPARPMLGERRLPAAVDAGLGALADAVDADPGQDYWFPIRRKRGADPARPYELTHADVVLRDVVLAVARHGGDAVRDRLRTPQRRDPAGLLGPFAFALDLWTDGALTPAALWVLALRSCTLDAWRRRAYATGTFDPESYLRLSTSTEDLTAQVATGEPVLPSYLDQPAARLTFLRGCETLLQAGSGVPPLSTPAYADGTLDLDDLLPRLAAAAPSGVGPLDLVQALYRLRPVDPERAADLDLPAVRTAPALSDPNGSVSLDAVALLRTWVAAGGIRGHGPRRSDDGKSWLVDLDAAPVPWSAARAAPPELSCEQEITGWAGIGAPARVFPVWPDRILTGRDFADGFGSAEVVGLLARMGGTFGVGMHNLAIALTTRLANADHAPEQHRREIVAVLTDLDAHGRLDPALLAEAARGRAAAGTAALTAMCRSWERLVDAGALSVLWPVASAVTSGLCLVTPRPAGLAALLRLLTAMSKDVPDPVVPQGVRALAESRGTSRSHAEARLLVTSVEGGT